MGTTTPVILKFQTPELHKVVVDCSNGKRYYANLKTLSSVYCYPDNLEDWKKANIDSYGLGLQWGSQFEAHIDQIMGLAEKTETISESA